MNILKRTLAGLLVVFLAFGQVTSIPGTVDAVMGFSNLTIVGAIPYVSAPGMLSQDSPGIHWDATSNRLGLGTASPSATLSVGSNAFTVTSAGAIVGSEMQVTGGPLLSVAGLGSGGTGAVYGSGNPAVVLKYGGSGGTIAYALGNTGSTGIGPSNTSPTGTLHVYDATATTGSTLVTFARGAAQTASSTILTMNGVPQFAGTNTTGGGTALLGTNSPAITNTEPYTWIRVVTSDGSTAYIPAWK